MQKSFNNWDKVGKAIKPVAKAVVRKVALDAKAHIQAQIQANGQIDTGFMFNGVYVVTSDSSDYKGGEKALPQVARPASETEAAVAVAANYAIIQEDGSIYQAGRPFFKPGIERVRPGFDKAMLLIKQKMEEAASQ